MVIKMKELLTRVSTKRFEELLILKRVTHTVDEAVESKVIEVQDISFSSIPFKKAILGINLQECFPEFKFERNLDLVKVGIATSNIDNRIVSISLLVEDRIYSISRNSNSVINNEIILLEEAKKMIHDVFLSRTDDLDIEVSSLDLSKTYDNNLPVIDLKLV